jgi:hypothetical protein
MGAKRKNRIFLLRGAGDQEEISGQIKAFGDGEQHPANIPIG